MAEAKKQLTVTLQTKELMYDIQNKAYLTGQAREKAGMGFEEASNMQASEDSDNDYQLRRSLTNHFTALKSLLGEYLNENKTTTDNLVLQKIESEEELTMSFMLPTNYNNASVDSLGNGIHAYLVNMSLFDWFTITNKNDAKDYYELAKGSLETVKRALYKRSRPTRPTYTTTPASSGS